MFTNKYCGGKNSLLPKKFILKKVTFELFVLELSELKKKNKLNKIDTHIKEQSNNYISNKNSYIIKLEEFDEKIIKIYKQLNLDVLIPKIDSFFKNNNNKNLNKTKKNQEEEYIYDKEFSIEQKIFPDYKYFYNQELLDLVYEIYKDDFINFGYKKGEI